MTHLRHISLFLFTEMRYWSVCTANGLALDYFIRFYRNKSFPEISEIWRCRKRKRAKLLVRNRGGGYLKWVLIIQSYYFKWLFLAVTFALLARRRQYLQFFTTIVLSPVQLELNWEVFSYICAKIVSFIVYMHMHRVCPTSLRSHPAHLERKDFAISLNFNHVLWSLWRRLILNFVLRHTK